MRLNLRRNFFNHNAFEDEGDDDNVVLLKEPAEPFLSENPKSLAAVGEDSESKGKIATGVKDENTDLEAKRDRMRQSLKQPSLAIIPVLDEEEYTNGGEKEDNVNERKPRGPPLTSDTRRDNLKKGLRQPSLASIPMASEEEEADEEQEAKQVKKNEKSGKSSKSDKKPNKVDELSKSSHPNMDVRKNLETPNIGVQRRFSLGALSEKGGNASLSPGATVKKRRGRRISSAQNGDDRQSIQNRKVTRSQSDDGIPLKGIEPPIGSPRSSKKKVDPLSASTWHQRSDLEFSGDKKKASSKKEGKSKKIAKRTTSVSRRSSLDMGDSSKMRYSSVSRRSSLDMGDSSKMRSRSLDNDDDLSSHSCHARTSVRNPSEMFQKPSSLLDRNESSNVKDEEEEEELADSLLDKNGDKKIKKSLGKGSRRSSLDSQRPHAVSRSKSTAAKYQSETRSEHTRSSVPSVEEMLFSSPQFTIATEGDDANYEAEDGEKKSEDPDKKKGKKAKSFDLHRPHAVSRSKSTAAKYQSETRSEHTRSSVPSIQEMFCSTPQFTLATEGDDANHEEEEDDDKKSEDPDKKKGKKGKSKRRSRPKSMIPNLQGVIEQDAGVHKVKNDDAMNKSFVQLDFSLDTAAV